MATTVETNTVATEEPISAEFPFDSRYLEGAVEALALENVTLVLHDWGSALGFDYARRHEHNIRALAFMEAVLAPVPSWDAFPPETRLMFEADVLPAGVDRLGRLFLVFG